MSAAFSGAGSSFTDYSPVYGRLPAASQPVLNTVDGEFSVEQHGECTADSRSYIKGTSEVGVHPDDGHATIMTSTVAYMKSMLGLGLISMPYICKEVGLVPYCLFLFIFMFPSHIANMCLAHSVEIALGPWNGSGPRLVERADYVTLGVLAFGQRAKWPIIGIFFVECWGGTLPIFIVLWDILADYVKHIPVLQHSYVFVPIIGLCVFPLCLLDSLHALRHTSIFGVFGVTTLGISLAYWSGKSENDFTSTVKNDSLKISGIALLPVFVLTYMGQYNFIGVYRELKERSPARVNVVSILSLVLSFIVNALAGICGYWAFAEDTNEDIFKNYADLSIGHNVISGAASHGVRVLYALSMAFTAPVFLFEARNMAEDILAALWDDDEEKLPLNKEEEVKGEDVLPQKNMRRRVGVMAFMLSTLCLVAVVYPHVVQALAILGATTSTALMLVLPPAFVLHLSALIGQPLSPVSALACKVFCVAGALCIPLFLSLVIWQMIDPADSSDSSDSVGGNVSMLF